jgi:transposase-like protein
MSRNRQLLGWFTRPGCVQIALALSAVLYLASVWLFPQLNPTVGLLLVIWLAIAGGTYVFVVLLWPAPAQSRTATLPPATQTADRDRLSAVPSEADPLSITRPYPALSRKTQPVAPFVPAGPPEPGAWRRPPSASIDDTAPEGVSPRQRIAWRHRARRAAHAAGDLQTEATHLAELGTAYRHLAQPRRALVCDLQALAVARKTGNQRVEETALGDIALAYADLGNPRQAVDYYEQYLRFVRVAGDRAREARAIWNLGLAYEELADLPHAIAAMQVCVDYERALGHPEANHDAAQLDRLRARFASETPRRSESPQSPGR